MMIPSIANVVISFGLLVLGALSASATVQDLARENRRSVDIGGEGFCALDSARACAEGLNFTWKSTKELERLPVASFRQIAQALDSIGLKTKAIEVNSRNVKAVQRRIGEDVLAIGWLSPHDMDEHSGIDVGHFALFNDIKSYSEITLIDANLSDIYAKNISDDEALPLLLVSPDSLNVSATEVFQNFVLEIIRSPWTIAMLTLLLLCVCANHFTRRLWVSRTICFCFGATFFLIFVLSRLSWESSSTPERQGTANGPLLFQNDRYDFGLMYKEDLKPNTIRLHNLSDQAIQISEIRKNCGCLRAAADSSIVPANGSVAIEISFSTIIEGANGYQVQVFGTAGESATCRIEFDGRSAIEAVPDEHFLGAISRSRDAERIFQIELELAYFYENLIRTVDTGSETAEQPLQVSVGKIYGDSNQFVSLNCQLNPRSEHQGFTFQKVPLIVDYVSDKTTIFVKVGADFVE